jgi:hypothetical protein
MEMGNEKYFYEEKEYDLSKDSIRPWVMGQVAYHRYRTNNG